MISVTSAQRQEVTRIVCPVCGERVKGVGLVRNSEVRGLTFRCARCGGLWEVRSGAPTVVGASHPNDRVELNT